jgi:hypothetical protein
VVQLKISLDYLEPEIWRRLLVPGDCTLSKLHDVFQAAMGWQDGHLHSFTIQDRRYGVPNPDWNDDALDERRNYLTQIVTAGDNFTYESHFGDSWTHGVVVESIERSVEPLKHAVCLEGARACPPEDCGGLSGFERLCEALADPDHEEHGDLTGWVGGGYDPAAFDLVATNSALERVR